VIDIVLPISAKSRTGDGSDLHRIRALLLSARAFWRGGKRILIVTPDAPEVANEIRRLGLEKGVEILHDDDVFSGLPKTLHPWWRQQLIKLAVSAHVKTDFYLILDADCFFVAPTTESDLVKEGRGRISYGNDFAHSRSSWYRGCRQLGLEIPPETQYVNVTPFVMHSTLAQNALGRVAGDVWSIQTKGWSEYTLYQCSALQDGAMERFHYVDRSFIGNAVWAKRDLQGWDAAKCFDQSDFHLSLVQSNTGAKADWVWARIGQYLMK